MGKKVQLYYDVISPYSWIAFELLCRYRSRWDMDLQLCPFLLGGIMKGSENRPPGTNAAKASYAGKDLIRLRQYCDIPLNIPANVREVMFEKGSLKAQRMLTAAMLTCPDKLESLSRQIWMRVWSKDEDITDDASLREAGLKAGLSPDVVDNLIGQTQIQSIKDELRRTTQEALDLGAFGAPFIVAHVGGKKETFFGSDRLELLAFILGEKWEGPLPELKTGV